MTIGRLGEAQMSLNAATVRPETDSSREKRRVALALGLTGALGEELLAALVGSEAYRLVEVAVRNPIVSAAAKFRPWVPGTSVIAADDAFVCVADQATPARAASPIQPYGSNQLLDAARLAQAAGVRRLVVVAPLSALLQLNAASHIVSNEQELALVEMKFETLLIVRPTRDAETPTGSWLQRTVGTLGHAVLDIMLPAQVQAMRPKTAALAILTAVARTQPGVQVIGAPELAAIVAETMPALAPKRVRLR